MSRSRAGGDRRLILWIALVATFQSLFQAAAEALNRRPDLFLLWLGASVAIFLGVFFLERLKKFGG